MQPVLVALLILFVILAVVFYRVGFRKPPEPLTWRAQVGFLVIAFVLIPAVLFVLWGQTGAKKALLEIGVQSFPELRHASGIASGRMVKGSRVWVFHSDAQAEAAIAYYRDPQTRPQWQLTSESPALLVLRRESQRLAIAANESRGRTVVIFTWSDQSESLEETEVLTP